MTTLSAAGIDTRNVPEPMEECQPQEVTRESRDPHERLDVRDTREREGRDEKHEPRDSRDGRDVREPRESRECRERENRELRDNRDTRETRDLREPCDYRDLRDTRESRDFRENRDREIRDSREPRDLRDLRETREIRDPPEASPPRISPLLSVRRFRHDPTIDISTPTHPPIPKDEPPDEAIRPSSPEDDTISVRSNGAQNDNIGEVCYVFLNFLKFWKHLYQH